MGKPGRRTNKLIYLYVAMGRRDEAWKLFDELLEMNADFVLQLLLQLSLQKQPAQAMDENS
jgi:pentatricopeptide repeat protein